MVQDYDLELNKVINSVKKQRAKIVCLQLPDGLKPRALEIASEIEERSNAKCIIWLGSCFGACDVPLELEKLNVDLLVQFGHSEWPLKKK
jgi:2-(3-amino-3-carboxypropyl)histidine synthase